MKKIIILILVIIFISILPITVAEEINVHSGIKIPLRVERNQTSKNLKSGTKITLEVANDIYQDGILIFKKGNKAALNITEAKKAGFLGHAGKFVIIDGEVYDNLGNIHQLSFNQTYIGEEKTYPKVLLTTSVFFLFPLALFGFVKGGQAEITTSQVINAYLDENFKFNTNL